MPKDELPEIYLDLDRTLFKTGEFINKVWRAIGEANDGIDGLAELSRLTDFYIDNENEGYRDYDFSSHIEAVGLPVEQTYQFIRRSLKDRNFEYPGVGSLLRRLSGQGLTVKIFTYGRDDFQRLKSDLSQSLAGYEMIITLEQPKQYFFQGLGRKAILLDDKPIGELMPENVMFIQSIGYNGVKPPEEFDWQTVSSLEEFGDVVEGLLGGDKNI